MLFLVWNLKVVVSVWKLGNIYVCNFSNFILYYGERIV